MINCRACGEPIYNLNPRNLFKRDHEDIRHNIEALTGIKLYYDPHLPVHICSCCYLDLNHSMAFRERCLETHKSLMSVKHDKAGLSGSKILGPKYELLDPLDGQDHCDDNDDNGAYTEFSDTIDYIENNNEASTAEVSPNIEPLTISHMSPRVRVLRCRDPNETCQKVARPTELVDTTPTKNITRPVESSLPPALGQMYAIEPIEVTDPEPPGLTQKYQPAARNDEARIKKKRRPQVAPKEKRFVCDQCGWSFRDLSNMKDHALRHTGVKKFECEDCDSKFFTRPLLMLHVRVHHKGEMPFKCKYCGMGFRNSPSRCRHERNYHASELPYECNLCSRTFISKISLEKHKLVHEEGEEIYYCEICRKTFKGATTLKNHFLTKFHQRRVNMVAIDYDETTAVSDEEIDFDFADSIIEEIDE